MDISLDILHSGSLREALQKFFQSEVLDGNNKYKRDNCKEMVAAGKQMSILEAPNVLVIQLKRFEGIFGRKIDKTIAIDEILVLSSHMCKGSKIIKNQLKIEMELDYDLDVEVGKRNLMLLFNRELEYMGDLTHLDEIVKSIRASAVKFMIKHYDESDSLVPYMAMSIFDIVVSAEGKIPQVFPDIIVNSKMLKIGCLVYAWRMRDKEKDKDKEILKKMALLLPKEHRLTDLKLMLDKICKCCKFPEKRMMKPLMPFVFLHFFAKYLPVKLTDSSFLPMYKAIIQSKCDVQFTAFRPSIIGASGLLLHAAHSLGATYQSLESQVMAIDTFATEKDLIYSCSKMMEKLYKPGPPPQFPRADNPRNVQIPEIELAIWDNQWDEEDGSTLNGDGDGSNLELLNKKVVTQAHDYSAVSLTFPLGWSEIMKAGGADANYKSPDDDICIIL